MKPQSKTNVNDDNISQHFNDVLKSLAVTLDTLYKNNAQLVISIIFFVLICLFVLFRAINISYIYSLVVTFLFILLSIRLYIKDKNSLNSMFTFSLGIFTAFTVTRNRRLLNFLSQFHHSCNMHFFHCKHTSSGDGRRKANYRSNFLYQ